MAIDPQTTFCPNLACPARAQIGQGNIRVHSQKRQRYRCLICSKTFSTRHGTPFFRRRTDEQIITQVLTLIAYGCPIPAIKAAFALQAQTVREWVEVARAHAEALHHAQVVQPRDLGQVQADEMHIRTQAGVLWMALALMVNTRLWLGGTLSPRRDRNLLTRLFTMVAACARFGPLLIVTDGLKTYVEVVRKAFRSRQTGTLGRPRLNTWPEVALAQVVKQYDGRAVTGTRHRLLLGSVKVFLSQLWSTPGCQVLNTAFIERLNGTFRSRLAVLGRRTRCAARRARSVERGMFLVGTVYNFCATHQSLTLETGIRQIPAMAAGITDHVWTVSELLRVHVPPPRWQPPRRRGRRSKQLQALIDRWCPDNRLA